MSDPTGENNVLHELKVVVGLALAMAEVSQAQHAGDLPITEWLLDPAETERERVGLRGILAAITELESGPSFQPPGGGNGGSPFEPSGTESDGFPFEPSGTESGGFPFEPFQPSGAGSGRI